MWYLNPRPTMALNFHNVPSSPDSGRSQAFQQTAKASFPLRAPPPRVSIKSDCILTRKLTDLCIFYMRQPTRCGRKVASCLSRHLRNDGETPLNPNRRSGSRQPRHHFLDARLHHCACPNPHTTNLEPCPLYPKSRALKPLPQPHFHPRDWDSRFWARDL